MEKVFLDACRNGNLQAVKDLQSLNIYQTSFALEIAIKSGYVAIVSELLKDSKVIPNFSLVQAVESGHLDVVKLLLSYPTACHQKDNAISAAVCKGHIEIVRFLLYSDPPVDERYIDSLIKKYSKHQEIIDLFYEHKYKMDNKKYYELVKQLAL